MTSEKHSRPATDEQKRPRSWQFDKDAHRGALLGQRNPQLGRYWAAVNRPTVRNRGPHGPSCSAGGISYTFVTIDVSAAEAFAMSGGRRIAPEGRSTLRNCEIAGPFYVKRKAKQSLARWRKTYPGAHLIRVRLTRRYSEDAGRDREVFGVSHWEA